jgi:hypothetical protein
MYDDNKFVVESILNHRGDRNRRTQMEFLVRWSGYSVEYDTWEPCGNLRDTDQLIEYLQANRMKSLIPAISLSSVYRRGRSVYRRGIPR